MELNIRGRLLRQLFEEKAVPCNQELYLRSYPVIWPCEDVFQEFLSTPDAYVQMSAAKVVYSCIGAEEDVFLPGFTWKKLIFLQQTRLANRSKDHIAQDHVVHSINLYILGIYAFFNMPIFQRKLLKARDGLPDTETERLLQFVKKWKLFSLYHDLGYVFESLVGHDGIVQEPQILSSYEGLSKCILSECVSRSVSRQIVATAIARKRGKPFQVGKHILAGTRWFDEAGEETPIQALEQILESCKDYRLLEEVQSLEGLHPLAPLLRRTAGLAVVEQQKGNPLVFVRWEEEGNSRAICRHDASLPAGTLYAVKNMIPLDVRGLSIRYYLCVEDFEQRTLNGGGAYRAFHREVQQFDTYLPEQLRRQFSLIYHDSCITQAFYKVCDWHQAHWGQSDKEQAQQAETLNQYGDALSTCFAKAIQESVQQETKTALKNTEVTVKNLEEIIKGIGRKIQAIDLGKVQKDAIFDYEKGGIPGEIFDYSRRLYWNLWETLECRTTGAPYMRMAGQNIQITPFSFEADNGLAKALYAGLKKRGKELDLDLEMLETYQPDFSTCDHGVVSAMLLFQALAFCHDLSRAAQKNSPIEFAWNAPGGIHEITEEKSTALYADAIFAILLHNIYTKRAQPKYGLCYRQDIDQNPFSYFCALMDNLQKWNRPKQIDLSVMDLPEDHYLGNNFDLEVSKGRLRIICHSTYAGKMRENLEYTEDYLPGVLSLVCVTEEEL